MALRRPAGGPQLRMIYIGLGFLRLDGQGALSAVPGLQAGQGLACARPCPHKRRRRGIGAGDPGRTKKGAAEEEECPKARHQQREDERPSAARRAALGHGTISSNLLRVYHTTRCWACQICKSQIRFSFCIFAGNPARYSCPARLLAAAFCGMMLFGRMRRFLWGRGTRPWPITWGWISAGPSAP